MSDFDSSSIFESKLFFNQPPFFLYSMFYPESIEHNRAHIGFLLLIRRCTDCGGINSLFIVYVLYGEKSNVGGRREGKCIN